MVDYSVPEAADDHRRRAAFGQGDRLGDGIRLLSRITALRRHARHTVSIVHAHHYQVAVILVLFLDYP